MLLEIACFNAASAGIAQQAGAGRIELCENYSVGGVTPSQELISEVVADSTIPVHVIIRPRGGNFVYTKQETKAMKTAITFCKEQGVKGVVLGALTEKNTIDLSLCKELIDTAGALPVSFHRAIDQCPHPDEAIQQLIDLGIKRVLTSGFTNSAEQGIDTLKRLQGTYGKHIILMPGGGIRSTNIKKIMTSGCSEYHSAALTGNIGVADAAEIKALKQLLTGNK